MRKVFSTTSLSDSDSHQAFLASIVESSEDAIISKTINGIITSWNRSAETMFGYKGAEVLGKHISLLIPERLLSEEDVIMASILKGEKIINFKTIRKTKTHNEIDIALTVSPMFDYNGKIIGASKIARDISLQVMMETQLLESNLALQKSNIYKDEFIALLGHELRTPLTSLKSCLELEQVIPDRKEELLSKARTHVNRINEMLSELLDLAQIQSGRLDLNIVKEPLQDIVAAAIELIQQAHPSHHIEYLAASNPLFVLADSVRMEQVVMNLLTNAVKYSPGADKIIVRLQRVDDMAEISVKDYGLGIPESDLDKIWTRFYRVPSHRNQIKGLGLGLHLCRQLVSAHKGSLWVESQEGMGSTFRVRVPLAPDSNDALSNT